MRLLFFSVLSLALTLSCTPSQTKVRSITPKETEGLLRNDFAIIVDVREADELKEGIIPQSRWMPTSKIEADSPEWKDFVSKLPRDKEIIFYCRSGRRSGNAASKLAQLGFKTANMGGFSDWKDAGLPTQKP